MLIAIAAKMIRDTAFIQTVSVFRPHKSHLNRSYFIQKILEQSF